MATWVLVCCCALNACLVLQSSAGVIVIKLLPLLGVLISVVLFFEIKVLVGIESLRSPNTGCNKMLDCISMNSTRCVNLARVFVFGKPHKLWSAIFHGAYMRAWILSVLRWMQHSLHPCNPSPAWRCNIPLGIKHMHEVISHHLLYECPV